MGVSTTGVRDVVGFRVPARTCQVTSTPFPRLLTRVAFMLLALTVLGCDAESEEPVDATGPNLGDLVGVWSATTFEYPSPVDSTVVVNLLVDAILVVLLERI